MSLTLNRPKDSHLYQAIVVVCIILLVCQRIINVYVPVQLGYLVDALGYGHIPYKEIVLYVVYRALQGNQGAIGAARSVLWIPVSQSLYRRLSCAAFEHVLGLSLEFHLSKKTGEVTSALSRGAAMNTFLENFLFQVFPMVFDIFVAGVFFFVAYDPFYTIIVFFIMWSYIFLTIYMAKYRSRQRRDMATKSREMDAVKTDAIMAFETVQHNCAVAQETGRFRTHVVIYQKAERLVLWSLNGLNLTQSSIFSLGTALLVGVSAYKISIGEQKVSEFVTLILYFTQLQGPLNFFGTYYTMLQNNLIEAERMLDLVGHHSINTLPPMLIVPSSKRLLASRKSLMQSTSHLQEVKYPSTTSSSPTKERPKTQPLTASASQSHRARRPPSWGSLAAASQLRSSCCSASTMSRTARSLLMGMISGI